MNSNLLEKRPNPTTRSFAASLHCRIWLLLRTFIANSWTRSPVHTACVCASTSPAQRQVQANCCTLALTGCQSNLAKAVSNQWRDRYAHLCLKQRSFNFLEPQESEPETEPPFCSAVSAECRSVKARQMRPMNNSFQVTRYAARITFVLLFNSDINRIKTVLNA